MTNNSDMPINPLRGANNTLYDLSETDYLKRKKVIGLTKREHFAGLAMQATIAKIDIQDRYTEIVAELSIQMADALLEELEK